MRCLMNLEIWGNRGWTGACCAAVHLLYACYGGGAPGGGEISGLSAWILVIDSRLVRRTGFIVFGGYILCVCC